MRNNRIVVDLNKVQYASFYYSNQHNQSRALKPSYPTVSGCGIEPKEYCPAVGNWPRESMLDRAKRREILDVWKPTCKLQLTANHSLVYTGKRAISIFREFSRRQFKGTKKK